MNTSQYSLPSNLIITLMNSSTSLISGFIENVKKYPDNLALIVNEKEFTYSELMSQALPVTELITPLKTKSNDFEISASYLIENKNLLGF